MRIWFVNRFYWPDEPATAQLLGDLAEGLSALGHEVHVVCGTPARAIEKSIPTTRRGVTIHRLAYRLMPGDSLAARAIGFGGFLLRVGLYLTRHLSRGDRLVLLTDPPLLGFVAAIPSRLRGVRVFHWVQDIHPEVSIAVLRSGVMRSLLRLATPLRNLGWRGAACWVTPSASMAAEVRRVTGQGALVAVMHNWAPEGLAPANADDSMAMRTSWGVPQGALVLMYSGNLGRVHDMECIASLMAELHDAPNVHLVVIGKGAGLAELKDRLEGAGLLGNCHFLPACPRESLATSLSAADMHLVTLRAGCESYVFPSKLYGIAAVARPVLAIGPANSDLVTLVRQHGMGLAGSPAQVPGLAEELRALLASPERLGQMGSAARGFLQVYGDAQTACAHWQCLLA